LGFNNERYIDVDSMVEKRERETQHSLPPAQKKEIFSPYLC
jgi:hypothetical protein